MAALRNIRHSLPEDTPAIAALSAQLGYPVPLGEAAAYHEHLAQLPDHLVLVAAADGAEVVGWLHAFISRRLYLPPFAELGGVVVHVSHRRSRIASALLSRAEEWAVVSGCPVFRIRTNTQRLEAAPFYRHRGYTLAKAQYVYEKNLIPHQPA